MNSRKDASITGFTLIEVIVTLVVVAIVAAMMTSYFGTSITQSSVPIDRLKASGSLNEAMEVITAQYAKSPPWTANTAYAANAIILPKTGARTGLQYIATIGGTSDSNVEPTWPATGTVTDGSVTWAPNGAAPTLINQTWRPNKPYNKNTIVVNGGNQYITPFGGTSGSTAPSWPPSTCTGAACIVTESTGTPVVTWKYSGPAPTVILQTLIGAEGTDQTQTLDGQEIKYRVIENRFIKFDGSNQEVNINSDPDDAHYGRYLKVTVAHHSDAAGEKISTLFAIR